MKSELTKLGIPVKQRFVVSNSFLISVNAHQLEELKKNDDILEIHLDLPFKVVPGNNTFNSLAMKSPYLSGRRNDQYRVVRERSPKALATDVQWNIKFIGAQKAWSRLEASGKGMIYANADTGIDFKHSALVRNYLGNRGKDKFDHNYAWMDGVKKALGEGLGPCGINSQVPCDDNGHGTHTMSTAVGREGLGVAPGAQWMACRNMDRGVGSTATYLTCLDFFLAPTDLQVTKQDFKIICLSFI